MSQVLFVNDESWSRIMDWGQNSPNDWYHPITNRQFEERGFGNSKVNDIIPLNLGPGKGYTKVQIISLGANDYTHLRKVYGDFEIPRNIIPSVDRVIRVRRVL